MVWTCSWGGYALLFSLAYLELDAGTGALLLFGAVQLTMITVGLYSGERLSRPRMTGLAMAIAGMVWLLLPGVSTPPLTSALIMFGSGVCWGIYSLRGRKPLLKKLATTQNTLQTAENIENNLGAPQRTYYSATETTAGNFALAIPLMVGAMIIAL